MLRAYSSLLPPISTPSLFSLIPSLSLSSPLREPLISPVKNQTALSKALLVPNSPHSFHSFSFKGLSPMVGRHQFCPRGITASFSDGSGGSERSSGSREILVQHLLVKEDDAKLVLELRNRILQGEDLSDLAVEYSICPSKEEGGMLGWVRKGQMVPEFEAAAFGATLNKVVKCKTKFGWHLLQVLSEREESILEDIQPTELHEKMQDPSFLEDAQLIDVREPEEVFLEMTLDQWFKSSLCSLQMLPHSPPTQKKKKKKTHNKEQGPKLLYQVFRFFHFASLETGVPKLQTDLILKRIHMFCVTMACGLYKLPSGCRHRALEEYSMCLEVFMNMQSRLIHQSLPTEQDSNLPWMEFCEPF